MDRPLHGGRVAIIIREDIKHRLLNNIDGISIENNSLEDFLRAPTLVITAAYCPDGQTRTFEYDLIKLAEISKEVLLFGDLNAKHSSWNCATNNSNGSSLYNIQQQFPIHVYTPPTCTHFPHSGNTPSTIDMLISSSSCIADNIYTCVELTSDQCVYDA